MGNTKIIPCGFGPALVLVLLAGVVGGLGQWWADGGSQAVQLARCGALLAEAWEAAVVEEVLFRGVLLWACLSWARRRNEAYPRRAPRAHRHRFAGLRAVVDPVGFAVMASSLIFGLAHLFPEGSLMAPGADIGVAAIQGFLKVTQSTLFGVVMALLVVRSPYGSRPFPQRALSLMAPVIVHGLFDLLFWGPLLLTGGVLPSTYLTGNPADLVPLVITTVLLAWAVKSC
ncbi:CPBP family glutamic-type intramembrane protease [uncultured Adlercreutzia sp.]|uniref:CPBP family glutamic-type intramembrane protease n=1 Tax=uncultured Adlercreutzia sp. TaxID=875803 RepID=UPI00266678C6|nr:CPBP family glutamic-type intramembrane protease [uncultured Adlercreutzia sp.]